MHHFATQLFRFHFLEILRWLHVSFDEIYFAEFKAAFDMFDKDGDGKICSTELKEILSHLDPRAPAKGTKIKGFNLDIKGKILSCYKGVKQLKDGNIL